jgi:hypothetical protein
MYVELQGSWGHLTFLGSLVATRLDKYVDLGVYARQGVSLNFSQNLHFVTWGMTYLHSY